LIFKFNRFGRYDGKRRHFETFNLTKEFGALVAVDHVSMKVRANTLHAIIGPNGAGKPPFSTS